MLSSSVVQLLELKEPEKRHCKVQHQPLDAASSVAAAAAAEVVLLETIV